MTFQRVGGPVFGGWKMEDFLGKGSPSVVTVQKKENKGKTVGTYTSYIWCSEVSYR